MDNQAHTQGEPGSHRSRGRPVDRHYAAIGVAAAVGALAAAAIANNYAARRAERSNPPRGRFVEIDGVRLHYLERGEGVPLILLHGNGSMSEDFAISGLLGLASRAYRVIAFDRPGFGHSTRPRHVSWTPDAQAELLARAMARIGIESAVLLGHSWGASVALALALRRPRMVHALVLASGYYYPSVRLDVVPLSAPAIPVLGDVVGQTIAPLLSRASWGPMIRRMFAPAPVPPKFAAFPKELALRPSQIRASAEETAMMTPNAFTFERHYRELNLPVAIVAGECDRIVDSEKQSARLHRDIAHSSLHRLAGVGHMVHQSSPERLMAAIDQAADRR